jgi:hypothetical protein
MSCCLAQSHAADAHTLGARVHEHAPHFPFVLPGCRCHRLCLGLGWSTQLCRARCSGGHVKLIDCFTLTSTATI